MSDKDKRNEREDLKNVDHATNVNSDIDPVDTNTKRAGQVEYKTDTILAGDTDRDFASDDNAPKSQNDTQKNTRQS